MRMMRRSDSEIPSACSLDGNKLEDVRARGGGAFIARCPACAALGGDRKGEHLIIFPDGKYGCVVTDADPLHRREIHRLAGAGKHSPQTPIQPKKIPIRLVNSDWNGARQLASRLQPHR